MLQQQKVQTATSSRPSEESPNSARLSSHSQYSNCKVVREKNQSKKSSVSTFSLHVLFELVIYLFKASQQPCPPPLQKLSPQVHSRRYHQPATTQPAPPHP